MKNRITFCTFFAFLEKYGCGHTLKGWNQSFTYPFYQHDFWACSSAKSWVSALPSFAAIGAKGRVSSLAAFLGATSNTIKISLIPNAELILESIGINFEFNKQKTKKLVCHFLFATSGFWPILL